MSFTTGCLFFSLFYAAYAATFRVDDTDPHIYYHTKSLWRSVNSSNLNTFNDAWNEDGTYHACTMPKDADECNFQFQFRGTSLRWFGHRMENARNSDTVFIKIDGEVARQTAAYGDSTKLDSEPIWKTSDLPFGDHQVEVSIMGADLTLILDYFEVETIDDWVPKRASYNASSIPRDATLHDAWPTPSQADTSYNLSVQGAPWTQSVEEHGSYNNTAIWSPTNDQASSVKVTFDGSAIWLFGIQGAQMGSAKVILDNGAPEEVSWTDPNAAIKSQQLIWSRTDLELGRQHTLTIEPLSRTANPINIDFFRILGRQFTPEDAALAAETVDALEPEVVTSTFLSINVTTIVGALTIAESTFGAQDGAPVVITADGGRATEWVEPSPTTTALALDPSSSEGKEQPISTPVLIGGVLGGISVLLISLLGCIFCFRRSERKRRSREILQNPFADASEDNLSRERTRESDPFRSTASVVYRPPNSPASTFSSGSQSPMIPRSNTGVFSEMQQTTNTATFTPPPLYDTDAGVTIFRLSAAGDGEQPTWRSGARMDRPRVVLQTHPTPPPDYFRARVSPASP